MKNVLVLVQDYPNNAGGVALMYVHVRNKYYIQHGIKVTVLNFTSSENYVIDGVKVITEKTYNNEKQKYDIVISHAANIKNHYRFLKKNDFKFNRMIFFFHGHEVLMVNTVYPKPYNYVKRDNWIRVQAQNIYDVFKLSIWHFYFKKNAYKSDFVFVSRCLYNEFQKYVKNRYDFIRKKKFDFITIRNNMDSSTYCIDLVCKLAKNNPELKFLIIGKGEIFDHIKKPQNVTWINKFLKHYEMLDCINLAKCALMLTRRDTQGVMSCELVTYGIPLITSNLRVCREIFEGIAQVSYISNEIDSVNLKEIYNKTLLAKYTSNIKKFSYENTVKNEEILINK